MPAPAKTRVLVVDDSAIVRKVLSDILNSQPDLDVVGTAPDPFVARDKILSLAPDVLTLDIEMPRMDGLTFLDKLMVHHPLPVIVISSLTQSSTGKAMEALSRGAVDVLAKPGGPYSVGDLREDLPRRIRAAARSRPARPHPQAPAAAPPVKLQAGSIPPKRIVAIGASTGGTQAIEKVLKSLSGDVPPIVITQHIPDGPKVCYKRPSVDVLFHSVAQAAGSCASAALLTGMGSDGAEGMLAMLRAGARTVAQDEDSSVVFGMPREAIRLGAAQVVAPLDRVAAALFDAAR
ncbi:MAG: response regulator [Acidobacteria bacterium]|nr:response regulator [Acidobacteriota bacterium]